MSAEYAVTIVNLLVFLNVQLFAAICVIFTYLITDKNE